MFVETKVQATAGLFTAIRKQIGLKLDPVKAPTDVSTLQRISSGASLVPI